MNRWLTDPVECGSKAGFGLYLHVPFCVHRCGYCDFATYDDRPHLMGRYVAALRRDMERWAEHGPWPPVTSVFVGGGTPTVLPAADLCGLLGMVHGCFDVAADAELTVEANPETVDVELLSALVHVGVTRLSLGAQSFAPHVLATLERRHDPDAPVRAVARARQAGIREVNLDLIYGTPGETDGDWERTLRRVLELPVDHISAYALTVAENTPLARQVARGRLPAPDPDRQRTRFDTARRVLGGAGFDHYELSNWARTPARRCRHNLLYWRHGDYLGLGVGAHGHVDGWRWWSHRSVERYCAAVEAGRSPIAGHEQLTAAQRAEERLLLGLRLREGLHAADVPPLEPEAVREAVDRGLLQLFCGRFQAAADGWFLLDSLVTRLL